MEDVDAHEKADFGYRDGGESEGKESRDEGDSDSKDGCIYEL